MEEWLHIDWDNFHFLRPEFLYGLIGVAVVLILGFFGFRDEEKWKKSIAPHLRPYVIQKGSLAFRRNMHILLSLSLAIGCLGLAGPTWNEIEVPGKILETPVVIALDMSQSMMATDIKPNRLERAKFKISDLLDANPKARVALVGYTSTAHTIVPLCSDYNIITSHLEGLSPKILPFSGTDVQTALDLTDSITQISDAPSKLILITDELDEGLFKAVQKYVAQGNRSVELIPMNTVNGAQIPKPNSKYFYQDGNGNPVFSKLDASVLKKLSFIDGIRVNQLTLDNSDMVHLADVIGQSVSFQEEAKKKENNWVDRGMLLAIPLAILILFWFRKGLVIYSLFILVGFSSCDLVKEKIQDKETMTWEDLWYTKDYQGQKLEEEGKDQEAGDTYEDPMRKGVAYYKAGNYEAAIDAFGKDTTAQGAYNLGLAYYKNGDYAAAQMAFGEAAELNPELKDAANNYEMLGHLIDDQNEMNPEEALEEKPKQQAQNTENTSPEDLSGGGQEATKEDMEKERLEETTTTDIHKAEELEEVPEDFEGGQQDNSQKLIMRKVDDDPALFLKRKFAREVKLKKLKPKKGLKRW